MRLKCWYWLKFSRFFRYVYPMGHYSHKNLLKKHGIMNDGNVKHVCIMTINSELLVEL